MTALTPTEQATVERFGVFDEEILHDLEKHRRTRVRCDHDRRRAVVRMVCRNCGWRHTWCRRHHRRWLRSLRRMDELWCSKCQTTVPTKTWRALIREVML